MMSAPTEVRAQRLAPRDLRDAPKSTAEGGAKDATLIDEATRWITAATAGGTTGAPPAQTTGAITAERPVGDAPTGTQPVPLFDLSPTLGLVARDWRGSMKIAGRTVLLDELRPTASSRMAFVRLATAGRLPTFVQIGAGEWRIDTAMFPNARSYAELAGQVGVGFELGLASGLRVAGEGQYTFLFRELRYSADEVAPRMVGVLVAVKGAF